MKQLKDEKYFKAFLLITVCLSAILFITSCSIIDNYYVSKTDYEQLLKDYNGQSLEKIKISQELETLKTENNALSNSINADYVPKSQLEELQKTYLVAQEDITKLQDELAGLKGNPLKLKVLLNNMNDMLKNVYIGSASPKETAYTFTAFKISYKDKSYIITAGHCVNDNYGKEGVFKFKANFSQDWISPELLGYKADFTNLDDYGVFYSQDISGGLKVTADLNSKPSEDNYLLGSMDKRLSIFRNLGDSAEKGESGSPVVNQDGEVVGI
ncbi:MAG TPA: hypothetical protein VF347_04525, partial [Candidatus Humimicrobiaceae bacterium]